MTVDSKGRELFIVDNSVSGWTGHRGAYGALVLCFARLFAACGDADRGP